MSHIHFIGICGVGMSSLAILWKNKGWKVTGSDVGFYPPVSTHLEEHKIDFYPGWHPEKMGTPDLVVVGNVAGSENSEWQKVQNEKIPFVSYPELIAKNLIKKTSVVCAGTYGKTSTTALLSFILKDAGFKPTYMFGGLSDSLGISADEPEGSEISIVEGDEYKTARWDNKAKFFSYAPTHLLLTDAIWDHLDVYPTEQSYFEAFNKLVASIPPGGLILISEKIKNKPIKIPFCKIYGQDNACDYIYNNITQNKDGLHFEITHEKNTYPIDSPMIGIYMAENICAAFAMANELGVPTKKIISAVSKFNGIKRRLEKRGTTPRGGIVYDDIAHSPTKAKSILSTLKEIYSGKIYAVFEPNSGNRQIDAIPLYKEAFKDANEVIIPRLTKIKIKEGEEEQVMEGNQLKEVISKTHSNTIYMEDDAELVNYLKQKTIANDAIVFLGSHGFRGMIDSLVKSP
ncbi:MAG TPA: Mur ligase family protein [Candidatus Magasanikbacteria bacterium]|nr:Mur ligase family protein [Candidatus Magasanikbacteria bacterium]